MIKFFLATIALLVVLALAVYFGGHLFLGSIAKAGVNKFGPGITQTDVHLDGATISPLSGSGTLTGLTVRNPKGWSANDALSLGRVHIAVEPRSLLGDTIVINEVIVEQPKFLYETKLVASNIGDLLKNIEESLGIQQDPQAASEQTTKMMVKKLQIRDGTVILGLGANSMVLPMPPVNLTDIGVAEGGVTPAQVAAAVMRSVTTSVVAASTQAMIASGGTGGAAALEGAKQIGDALKGVFGGGQKKQPAEP
jgi:uncharacterized protein involved in outer membrane biogenesis